MQRFGAGMTAELVLMGEIDKPTLQRNMLVARVQKARSNMAKKRKRKYSKSAGREVKSEMHRYKRGKAKSGPGGKGGKVKSRKQAIAIALSKARKKGEGPAEEEIVAIGAIGSRAWELFSSTRLSNAVPYSITGENLTGGGRGGIEAYSLGSAARLFNRRRSAFSPASLAAFGELKSSA